MKSLKEELETEQVQHLDLSRYCAVPSGTPVREALAMMRAEEGRPMLIVRDETAAVLDRLTLADKIEVDEL